MKKISFTFKYSLPPGLRKNKNLKEKDKKFYPLIPVRFYNKNKRTSVIEALLDSGADGVHINRGIRSFLSLPQGTRMDSGGMGGNYVSYETKVGLIIGRGGREVDFGYVRAFFPEIEKSVPLLIGREPVFLEYQIIFEEYKKKFKLIPKEDILEKEKHKKR